VGLVSGGGAAGHIQTVCQESSPPPSRMKRSTLMTRLVEIGVIVDIGFSSFARRRRSMGQCLLVKRPRSDV